MAKVFLVADVGGTNTTFAWLRKEKEKYRLLQVIRLDSRKITDFGATAAEVLAQGKKAGHQPSGAGFAGAGVVSDAHDLCTITKLPWNIDAREIQKKAKLDSVLVINDFIAVAYGIEALPAGKLVKIKSGKIHPRKPKIVLGAGTGLGKAILAWNGRRYLPLASEGGHSDAALQTKKEYEFGEFIRKKYARSGVVWEDVLSGQGLSNLYQFFEARLPSHSKIRENNYDPALISASTDAAGAAAKSFFLRLYARCAQNLALDALALGGVYLAGGIVGKNLPLFKRKEFIDEFILNHRMKKVLEQIPVFAVTDYDVSLYGAAKALDLWLAGDFP